MSILSVDVPPTDVIGDALRLHLGPNGLHAVASRRVALGGGWALVLEVLAASHRVTVESPAGPVLVETVACGIEAGSPPVDPDRLPGRHEVAVAGGRYHFASERGDGPAVEAAAERLRAAGARTDTLVVGFPGHPDALTGLVVQAETVPARTVPSGADHAPADPGAGAGTGAPATVRWATWHVYPGAAGHVVTTSSSFARSEGRP